MKVKVYTLEYCPFVMGGEVWQPMATEVEADGPHDIGKGFEAYVVTAPNGKTFVAEKESGAFIGPDLKTVSGDIKIGELKSMKKQVEDAKLQMAKAKTVTNEYFWKKLKCA